MNINLVQLRDAKAEKIKSFKMEKLSYSAQDASIWTRITENVKKTVIHNFFKKKVLKPKSLTVQSLPKNSTTGLGTRAMSTKRVSAQARA
jgi:hypothetical protein